MTSEAPTLTDPAEFWSEVRRRRDHFFLAVIGWLPAGVVIMLLATWLLPNRSGWQGAAGFLAIFGWGAFSFWVGRKLTLMRCYRCGAQAFSHGYFFMRDAKCQNCGAQPSDA